MTSPTQIIAQSAFPTLLGLMLSASACGTGPDPEGEAGGDDVPRDKVIGIGYCPTHLCGSNSDIGGSFSFNVRGEEPNAELDMVLVQAYDADGTPVRIQTRRDGFSWKYDDESLSTDEGVVGGRIEFEHLDDGRRSILYVESYEDGTYPSFNNPSTSYDSYRFTYREEGDAEDVRRPLCSDYPWPDAFGLGELDATDVIIIQTEAYDWHGRAIERDDEFAWLTLGCMGGAFAKKVLMGYDPHHPDEEATTLAENEAMMRMLTARYCEGENHTEPGTPLYWQNDRGWYSLPEEAGSYELEALWTADGVACLDTPRFVTREEVEADCGPIPTCEGMDASAAHLASYRVVE